jgi:hypothetical protein
MKQLHTPVAKYHQSERRQASGSMHYIVREKWEKRIKIVIE